MPDSGAPRPGRPSKEPAKKVVDVVGYLDPALKVRFDLYRQRHELSQSEAVRRAILLLLASDQEKS